MQARRATGAPWKYSNVFLDQAELARKELLQVVHGGLEEPHHLLSAKGNSGGVSTVCLAPQT